WLQDLTRGTLTRLLSDTIRGSSFPAWNPDGRRVAFRTRAGIRVVEADGSGRSTLLANTTIDDFPNSIGKDGTILFQRQAPRTSGDVYALPAEGHETRPIVATSAYEGGAQFSPDQRWIAYASDESGRFEVYVRSYSGSERKWPVSTQGGTQP